MGGIRRFGVSRDILLLLALGSVVVFAPNAVRGLELLLGDSGKRRSRPAIRQALDRLQSTKLLSYHREEDGSIVYQLSRAGKKKVLTFKMDEICPKRPRRWDGRWRVIFSDISEKHKRGRDALRLKFYEWGFYPLQKSVVAYPFPCEEEVAIIRDLFHIPTRSLFIVETRHIPNERAAREYFGV